MSDEEDFDEFPSITVNSSTHESSSFSMPNAEELASQRAREEECERALLRLREEHDAADRECAGAMVSVLAHSDSSGSEGEAALAAAVCALRVRIGNRAATAPRAAAVLAAMRPHLPAADQFAASFGDALSEGTDRNIRAVTDEIASSISDMVLEAADADEVRVWSSEEILGIVAWLCAAIISGACQGKRRALLRTLHLIIDDVATEAQVQEICSLLTSSALESDAALELSDALRSGSPRSDALSHALAECALAVLADAQDRSMSGIASSLPGVWRRLSPPRQYLALQLLARLVPPFGGARGAMGAEEGQARRLLDVLAQTTPGQKAQTTDTLKVLVAATKLQVLFHAKK